MARIGYCNKHLHQHGEGDCVFCAAEGNALAHGVAAKNLIAENERRELFKQVALKLLTLIEAKDAGENMAIAPPPKVITALAKEYAIEILRAANEFATKEPSNEQSK